MRPALLRAKQSKASSNGVIRHLSISVLAVQYLSGDSDLHVSREDK